MASTQVGRFRLLDAMRGVAVLVMIPFHLLLFGGGSQWDVGGGNAGALVPVDIGPPLGTGLILFFFITGMALAVISVQKRGSRSMGSIYARVVKRYGAYLLIGAAFEFVVMYFLQPIIYEPGNYVTAIDVASILHYTFGGEFLTLAQPIIGLSLAAMMAYPFIHKMSWKALAAAALGLAVVVWGVLSVVAFPDFFLLNLLFTNAFAVFKGLTTVFFGAAMGKLLMEGKAPGWKYVAASVAVVGLYVSIPALINGNLIHIAYALWSYPHAIAFITASGLVMLSFFRWLEASKASFTAFAVLGRSAFIVYFGHFALIIAINIALIMLGMTGTAPLILGEMVISTALIWSAVYYFSKRKWGDPAKW